MEHFFLAGIAGDLAETAHNTAETFGLNWPLFISQCISFGIVAYLLQRFAYKPVLQVLAARRQRIADSLENAEKIKQALAEAEATRKELLEKANSQANKLIEEARAAAAKVQESETQKAIAAAEQIVAKATAAAQADRDKMMSELRQEIGRLVVETTAKVTGKILTADDQKRLIDDASKEIAA